MAKHEVDFEALKANLHRNILGFVQRWVPEGKLEGKEYVMINPSRADSKPGSFKININTGVWSDFATNQGGNDLISLYHLIYAKASMHAAAVALMDETGSTPAPPATPKKTTETWTPIIPVPPDAWKPFTKHFKHNKPSKKWEYKTSAGETMCWIYRFDTDHGKEVLPLSYCENSKGEKSWRWKGLNRPRPIYGLDIIKANPAHQILIVEGEKTADAARKIFKTLLLVTCWIGGTKNIKHTEWRHLDGKKLIYWPDKDGPGMAAALEVYNLTKGKAAGFRVVMPPREWSEKDDLADGLEAGYNQDMCLSYMKTNLLDPGNETDRQKLNKFINDREEIAPPASVEFTDEQADRALYPFKALGYESNIFYYLPDGGQQVVQFKGEDHNEKYITAYLAPLDFWQDHWAAKKWIRNPDTSKLEEVISGVDWKGIKRFLIWELQYKNGVFGGFENRRGPGVWKDKNRYVVHLGDRLIVDRQEIKMSQIETSFIYEKKKAVEVETFEPLSPAEGGQLYPIVQKFSWLRDVNPELLCGWVVASLIGGALPWRPHIWLNGPQSSGKSSVLKDIIRRILGNCISIFIEGATTEAGLRQQANYRSYPILFDEAESNDRRGQVRMEQIIELMRSSASPDGGKIIKGSSQGAAQSFNIQSCFCLASISNNSVLAADVARIVNLELMNHEGSGEKWEVMRKNILDTLNPEWCGRFRARVFNMLPTIRKNIDAFIQAVRDELDSQRFGDVYGVLLGSAYSISHDTPIEYDAARVIVKSKDWSEERVQRYEKDEIKCLITIMQRIVTIKGEGLQIEKTLYEICKELNEQSNREPSFFPEMSGGDPWNSADQNKKDKEIKIAEMDNTARRYGVIFKKNGDGAFIIIPNNNPYIAAWLKDTAYTPNWNKYLKRIREVVDDKLMEARMLDPRRFEKGQRSVRSIQIPFEIVDHYLSDIDEEN